MFRKEALEKLSSPEQLDQLLTVTSPRAWLALLGLAALIVAVVIWGIVGSIPSVTTGQGMLIRGDVVQLVYAPQAGRIDQILVKAGDTIAINQLLATLTTDSTTTEIHSTQAGRVLEIRVNDGAFV